MHQAWERFRTQAGAHSGHDAAVRGTSPQPPGVVKLGPGHTAPASPCRLSGSMGNAW